jgi:prepilin-type N-terminal cleavage/methylation domain-containing protein
MRKFKNSGFRILDYGFKIPHSAFRTPCTRLWPRFRKSRLRCNTLHSRFPTRQRWVQAPHSNGFTLIEIVITIVIVGIIAGIAAMIIAQGVRAYSDEQSRSDVHYQARLAVERMSREIKLIRSQTIADITWMNPTLFQYTDVQGNQMGFRLNAGNVERTQNNGVTWQTLATGGVITLNFSYLQQDGVTGAAAATLWYVDITMSDQQGTDTLQMRTRVHPRNF